MRVIGLAVLISAMTLGGCATVASHGTSQAVPSTSSPQGARVFVDSVAVGVTPLVATVSRRQSHVVSIVHDSFPPARVVMDRNVSPMAPGQLVLLRCPRDCRFVGRRGVRVFERYAACRSLRGAEHGTASLQRIPTESVATAAVLTGLFGLGSGHRVLGARAWPFFVTQFAGGTMAMTGLGMGIAGQDGGEAVFTTGLLVVVGSSIWEIADFISVTSERNRVVAAGSSAPDSASPRRESRVRRRRAVERCRVTLRF